MAPKTLTQGGDIKPREKEYKEILDNISFVVSHKIRSPVATMLGLLELIRMNTLRQEELRQAYIYLERCVNDFETNCRELGELVFEEESSC